MSPVELAPMPSKLDGDTPAIRLFALLEVIAEKDQYFSLQSLVEELGLPKPTLHRMLQQLDSAGMIQRDGDGRHYSTAARLRRIAENLLLNNTMHGARRNVLRTLVAEVGESCNITSCAGSEVLYLDRVETPAPLRFYLHPGSRVPVHCSASGKLFLAQMTPSQRRRLLVPGTLEKYTDMTITDPQALEAELQRAVADGYAMDNEEFLPGLTCIAVRVPVLSGKSNLAVAIQAPTLRFQGKRISDSLPALRRAADALADIEARSYPERAEPAARQEKVS
ncbi:IclR family transcriptional regulator [Castellaniella sp.]|uniref:IclR family transcriptional regulator n=1 Tax=Castellaniella sp. TaxID=1955812 RepID=UPI002AFE42F4|nr:IclR family transcriptional regulator [Castellaniella sp.]